SRLMARYALSAANGAAGTGAGSMVTVMGKLLSQERKEKRHAGGGTRHGASPWPHCAVTGLGQRSTLRRPRTSSACHRLVYEAANFISLIASLFVTAPPIRRTA